MVEPRQRAARMQGDEIKAGGINDEDDGVLVDLDDRAGGVGACCNVRGE